MNKKIYLLCGPAGSGKSTWAKKHCHPVDGAIISRDEVRFSLVKENEEYFSKETEVFDSFISKIRWAMDAENRKEVYIDATHISPRSRMNVLHKLNLVDVDIIPVVFRTSLATCLNRNGARSGRARVPDSVVANMYNSFKEPAYNEMFKYKKIIYVHEDGSEVEVSNG